MSVTKKDLQYMELCSTAARIFSTCGKKQYAAVLLDKHGHIIGFGYNGGPKNYTHCKDGGCPRLEHNSPSGSSYDNCISVHAEQNAIIHCDYSSEPEKIYVNGPPCFGCAKLICNTTIKKVVCFKDQDYVDWPRIKDYFYKSSIEVVEIEKESV